MRTYLEEKSCLEDALNNMKGNCPCESLLHGLPKKSSRSVTGSVAIVAVAMAVFSSITSDPGFSAPRKSVPLRLDVTLQRTVTEAEARLQVKVTNISEAEVTIDELNLPWIPPNELEFLDRAYRHDVIQSQLQKKGPMEDYFGRTINLQPKRSLVGTLKLKNYFSGFEEAVKQSDVTVVWNCRSRTLIFVCNEGERGNIFIPKKRSVQKKQ